MSLGQIIRQLLQKRGGKIPLSEFFALSLFHPEGGYYRNPQLKLGKLGDFHTSLHLGEVFAELLAFQLHSLFSKVPFGLILELGGFRGELKEGIARFFQQWGSPVAEVPYHLVDFQNGGGFHEFPFPPSLPPPVILANEFFDCAPPRLFSREGDKREECFIGLLDDKFVPLWEAVEEFPNPLGDREKFAPPWTLPFSPDWEETLIKLATHYPGGHFILIDYAAPETSLPATPRDLNRIRGFRKHEIVGLTEAEPGEIDLTYTLPLNCFQTVLTSVSQNVGVKTQEEYLLNLEGEFQPQWTKMGIHRTPVETVIRNQHLKRLVYPLGMGRSFKVFSGRFRNLSGRGV